MNDLELSLDDIIKKKLKKKRTFRNRNNAGTAKKPPRKILDVSNRVSKSQDISSPVSKSAKTGNVRGKVSSKSIGDARLRIIQKQRQKMTDAREKLGHIAKQTDARLRLLKLRERQRGNLPVGRTPVFRIEHPILQRTVNSRINNSYFDDDLMDYSKDVSYFARSIPDAAVISEDIYNYSFRGRSDESVLFRTVENEMPLNRLNEPEKNIYTWTKPHATEELVNIPVTRTNVRTSHTIGRTDLAGNAPNWDLNNTPIVITKKIKPQETVGILKRSSIGSVYAGPTVQIMKESPPPIKSKAPIRTLSERFCQEGNVSAQKINLLKAKLEANQLQKKNNTLYTQPLLGHRIVVSNLVPSVTHEDVKELFEDIGELISSKVVRPGTAEVVYKLQKDAVKAVDVYHNRQLDGQPMKCLLVNDKSTVSATKSYPGNHLVACQLLKVCKWLEKNQQFEFSSHTNGIETNIPLSKNGKKRAAKPHYLSYQATKMRMKEGSGKIIKPVVEVDMAAFRKALHKKSAS